MDYAPDSFAPVRAFARDEPDVGPRGRPPRRPCRRTLHCSATAFVEDLYLDPRAPPPRGHSAEHQIVIPYDGLFGWTVGQKSVLLDANRVLFVRGGEDFSEDRPVAGIGHSSAVVTPTAPVLDELAGASHAAFEEVTRPTAMTVRLLNQRLLRIDPDDSLHPLATDEVALAIIKETMGARGPRRAAAAPRVVDRAKQILHARELKPVALDEIARQVGVSPVYLTQSFTRSEGVPLYRYQLRLRMSRALHDLPHCDDITGLALDLGFSNHSHFSAAFKAAFGLTPSEFRRQSSPRARL